MRQVQTNGLLDRLLRLRDRLIPIIRHGGDLLVRPAVVHVDEPSDSAPKHYDKPPRQLLFTL